MFQTDISVFWSQLLPLTPAVPTGERKVWAEFRCRFPSPLYRWCYLRTELASAHSCCRGNSVLLLMGSRQICTENVTLKPSMMGRKRKSWKGQVLRDKIRRIKRLKSARGSKIVMEEGDRQRGVIVECNSGDRTEKQKKKKVREQILWEKVKYRRGENSATKGWVTSPKKGHKQESKKCKE